MLRGSRFIKKCQTARSERMVWLFGVLLVLVVKMHAFVHFCCLFWQIPICLIKVHNVIKNKFTILYFVV